MYATAMSEITVPVANISGLAGFAAVGSGAVLGLAAPTASGDGGYSVHHWFTVARSKLAGSEEHYSQALQPSDWLRR